jgi:DNA-binding transcriptional LysR family regulator
MIDLKDCKALISFSETLSFTEAARRLCVSQPALFERLKKLSERVGAPLYMKEGRTLSLTSHGVRLTAFAQDSLRRTTQFMQELRGEAREESVTLAAGEGAFLYLLGPAIRRFQKKDGGKLQLVKRGGASAIEALQDGSAHIAVAVSDLVPSSIEAKILCRTLLCAALEKTHPLTKKKTISLKELAKENLIITPEGRSHRELIGRALANIGEESKVALEADGWPLTLHFVSLGLGVGIVNGICQPPKNVVLRPIPELGAVTYRLCTRRGAYLPECAKRLHAELSE